MSIFSKQQPKRADGLPPIREARKVGKTTPGRIRNSNEQAAETNDRLARLEVLLARQVELLERIAERD